MAQNLLRLRRSLSSSSSLVANLHRSLSATSALSSVPRSSSPSPSSSSSAVVQSLQFRFQSRSFRSSSFSSARPPYGSNNQNDEIGPDTILFEGCDYNHWLIVMDFPRDNKPSPEEMVRTYEETCARGLNISVEEAKKKIYACSTTTYTGFQVLMTEEESEKFNGVPGVIFVLPDSYIDPQNKEYGGDKYDNGQITPRPPPFQYERQGSRYRDRNRYERQGPMPNQQGNSSYGQQGSPQGGGNYRTSQNYPHQTYAPPGQGENRGHAPVNSPGGRDAYQPGRGPTPSYQGNYNQRVQGNGPQGEQSAYAPPGQVEYRGNDRTYGYGQGPSSGTHGHGLSGLQGPGTGESYGQGPSGGSYGQGPSAGGYGQGPSAGGYGQGPSAGGYGQGQSAGGYGQGPRAGASGQGPISGAQVQGPSSGYPGHGDQSFTQGEPRRMQGEQTNYAYMGQTGTDQGRY
ncbi:multiple organellar RNA editing factor 1, mitochondrial [Rosa sericea]